MHEKSHPGCQPAHESRDEWFDAQVADDGQGHAENTDLEIVYEHLEPGMDPAVEELVDLFEEPRCEGAYYHRAKEHCDVGADDDAHRGDRADDATTCPVDDLSTGVADEDGKQIGQDRVNELGEGCIGCPSRFDEKSR